MCKSYLRRLEQTSDTAAPSDRAKFPELLRALTSAAGDKLAGLDLASVSAYHNTRNKLYHEGAGITVNADHLDGYARLAVTLLRVLLDVNLRHELDQAGNVVDHPFEAQEAAQRPPTRPRHAATDRRDFTIIAKRTAKTTSKGNVYLECETTLGTVAFWASPGNRSNVHAIEQQPLPVSVTAQCIKSNWQKHDLWVPESAEVVVHE